MSETDGGQPVTDDLLVARAPQVLTRWLADGVLLLAPGAEAPVALRGTGGALWEAMERPSSTATIAAELAVRYEAAPDVVADDVRAALRALLELDLAEVRPPAVGAPGERAAPSAP